MKVYKPVKKNFHPPTGGQPNRFNKRHEQAGQSFSKLYWLGAIILIIFGTIAWWLLLSPSFRLTEVTTSDAKNFSTNDIKTLVWDKIRTQGGILPKDNLWLVDTKSIEKTLNEAYYLENLHIKKRWPHKLSVEFQEKNYALAWSESNNYYLINFQGDIISNQGAVPPGMLVIYNRGTNKKGERRIDVEEKYLSFADKLNKAFNEKIKGLNERQIFLDDDINTIKIQITDGPVLKFNTEDSIDKQLIKLETIRKQELPDGQAFNNQQCLDLRYGDRIFYQ